MRNYKSRVPLPHGKWAYDQMPEFAKSAKVELKKISLLWSPPKYFFHFRNGGHLAALRSHEGKQWFCKLDLSRFFSRVTRHRIVRRLKSLGYSYRDAEDFSVASTVWDRQASQYVLPFGFVQSTVLASIELDKGAIGQCIRKLKSENLSISVYVDDIIMSADDRELLDKSFATILEACEAAQLPPNPQKLIAPVEGLAAFNILLARDVPLAITDQRLNQMNEHIVQSGIGPRSKGILAYIKSVNQVQANTVEASHQNIFAAAQVST